MCRIGTVWADPHDQWFRFWDKKCRPIHIGSTVSHIPIQLIMYC